jgi:hypothetical protein
LYFLVELSFLDEKKVAKGSKYPTVDAACLSMLHATLLELVSKHRGVFA